MTTPQTPKCKTPRPQCGDCKAWQSTPGCGWLDSAAADDPAPCHHSTERRRFDGESEVSVGERSHTGEDYE